MTDTSKKSSFNMIRFVATIFVAALVLAGIYFYAIRPGEPDNPQQPAQSAPPANP